MENKKFVNNGIVIGIVIILTGTCLVQAAVTFSKTENTIQSFDGETYFPYLEVQLENETKIFYPTDDVYINNKNPNEQLGSYPDLAIRNRYGAGSDIWECDMLLRFNLSAIPTQTPILHATLNLYYAFWQDTNPAGRPLTVYKITSDWNEMVVTYVTKPALSSTISTSAVIPATPLVEMTWDLTNDVQQDINNPETNFGWQIMDETYWGTYNVPNAHFYSKEYQPPEPAFTPYLEVQLENETKTFYPIADGYINNKNPNEQLGNYPDLAVRNRYGAGSDIWECDMLFRFDISDILPQTPIIQATLNLYYAFWKDTNPAGRPLNVYKITSDWQEMTVTFVTKPTIATTISATQIVPSSGGVGITWDVTTDVQQDVNTPETNFGWQIMDETYWGTYDVPNAHFYSKEYGSPPAASRPAFIVGRITNKVITDHMITFEAVRTRVILLTPVFDIFFYHSQAENDLITIENGYVGLVGARFIVVLGKVSLPS